MAKPFCFFSTHPVLTATEIPGWQGGRVAVPGPATRRSHGRRRAPTITAGQHRRSTIVTCRDLNPPVRTLSTRVQLPNRALLCVDPSGCGDCIIAAVPISVLLPPPGEVDPAAERARCVEDADMETEPRIAGSGVGYRMPAVDAPMHDRRPRQRDRQACLRPPRDDRRMRPPEVVTGGWDPAGVSFPDGPRLILRMTDLA